MLFVPCAKLLNAPGRPYEKHTRVRPARPLSVAFNDAFKNTHCFRLWPVHRDVRRLEHWLLAAGWLCLYLSAINSNRANTHTRKTNKNQRTHTPMQIVVQPARADAAWLTMCSRCGLINFIIVASKCQHTGLPQTTQPPSQPHRHPHPHGRMRDNHHGHATNVRTGRFPHPRTLGLSGSRQSVRASERAATVHTCAVRWWDATLACEFWRWRG